MEETRLKDIMKALQDAGFDVYTPGMHKGQCKDTYIVVKDAGTMQMGTFSTLQYGYDIMLYVPVGKFSQLDLLMQKVRTVMNKLSKKIALRIAYEMSAPFYDDTVKAYMSYATYINLRKL